MDFSFFKLEIFVPESHFRTVQRALQRADAGHIGAYDSCLSYSRVTGVWRPLDGATPYLGSVGAVSEEPEIKIETVCRAESLDDTLRAVKEAHPYEEPVINVLPLWKTGLD